MKIFELGSFHSLLNNGILQLQLLVQCSRKFWIIRATYLLFALWAVQVVEDHSRSIPPFLHHAKYALRVVDVSTVKHHARLLTHSGRIADRAKIILANLGPLFWWHFLNTLGLQAR